MSSPIIKVKQLCKAYGNVSVLQDVDMQVSPGKLVGFLGPNGAGKSTAIRILMGLLQASSGSCELFGRSIFSNGPELRRKVGYLPGDVNLYSNRTGIRTLEFLAGARKVDCRRQVNRLADVFELPLKRNVRSYSTGMKQKLGLIQSMMHEPQLLVLDEPTSALDPLVRQSLFSELRAFVAKGRTVLFSSHSLDEVQMLCDEVVILRKGKIVEHQAMDVLQGRALRRIKVTFANQATIPQELPSPLKLHERKGEVLSFTWSGSVSELLEWLEPYSLDDLIIEQPDLNDLFMTYYSDDQQAVESGLSDGGHHD